MIRFRIVMAGRHVLWINDAPTPEVHLDEIVLACTRAGADLEEDMRMIGEVHDSMDCEWVDPQWTTSLCIIVHLMWTRDLPDFQPGDLIEVWHDQQLVVTHWLLEFGSYDQDMTWASLPNWDYDPVTPRLPLGMVR